MSITPTISPFRGIRVTPKTSGKTFGVDIEILGKMPKDSNGLVTERTDLVRSTFAEILLKTAIEIPPTVLLDPRVDFIYYIEHLASNIRGDSPMGSGLYSKSGKIDAYWEASRLER